MYRVCVCDDDTYITKSLSDLLIMYSFQNEIDFKIEQFETPSLLPPNVGSFDIIFLDIEFEEKQNGIEIAKQMRRSGDASILVFITSHANYSIKGYEAEAFRFIVKPFSQARIFKVLDDCLAKLNRNKIIKVKTNNGVELIRASEIIYILSEARKRNLYLERDDVKSTWQNLKELYALLPSTQFQYAQKSFIVNLDKIKSISNNIITMENGDEISISRLHKEHFLRSLQLFLGE